MINFFCQERQIYLAGLGTRTRDVHGRKIRYVAAQRCTITAFACIGRFEARSVCFVTVLCLFSFSFSFRSGLVVSAPIWQCGMSGGAGTGIVWILDIMFRHIRQRLVNIGQTRCLICCGLLTCRTKPRGRLLVQILYFCDIVDWGGTGQVGASITCIQ